MSLSLILVSLAGANFASILGRWNVAMKRHVLKQHKVEKLTIFS